LDLDNKVSTYILCVWICTTRKRLKLSKYDFFSCQSEILRRIASIKLEKAGITNCWVFFISYNFDVVIISCLYNSKKKNFLLKLVFLIAYFRSMNKFNKVEAGAGRCTSILLGTSSWPQRALKFYRTLIEHVAVTIKAACFVPE